MFFRTIIALMVTSLLLLVGMPVFAASGDEGKKKLTITSFDVSQAGSYSYLGDPLQNLLVGRLSKVKEIDLVDLVLPEEKYEQMKEALLLDVADYDYPPTDADFIGTGQLREVQGDLLLEMAFYSKKEPGTLINLVMSVTEEEEVLKAIDSLAEDIQVEVLGLKFEEPDVLSPEEQLLSGFETVHPEKAYLQGLYGSKLFGDEDGGSIISKGARSKITFDKVIQAIERGDLDNDGVEEIVVLLKTKIMIVRSSNNRLNIIDSFSLGNSYKAAQLYLADMDDDGMQELYVSGNVKFKVNSRIFSWAEEDGITQLDSNIRWYIRPLETTDGKILLGQRGTTDVDKGLIADKVVVLMDGAGKQSYVEGAVYVLPKKVNIFDFTLADIDGDGLQEYAVIDRKEKLRIYDENLTLLWVSENEFGGSTKHFGPTMSSNISNTNDSLGTVHEDIDNRRIKVYIPSRIIAVDLTEDGREEIIVARNIATIGMRLFHNSRSYSDGFVSCMKWVDGVMDEIWKTRSTGEYLVDYGFKISSIDEDVEGKTRIELLVAQERGGSGFGLTFTKNSLLSSYLLEMKRNNEEIPVVD